MAASNFIDIHGLAKELQDDVISIRRHLHSHPELSYEESETAAFIASQLRQAGISHETNVGGYGVVGIIQGNNPGKVCIALRADMDALPIEEENQVAYRSKISGKMHACGHDAHMAVLLGTAKLLNSIRNQFEGTIKLLFQPAEENLPGGAKAMIEEGVLHNPKVDAIVGLHVTPELKAGLVGFHSGAFMASGDEINIKVKGQGGHAAMPHQLNDTVVIAAQIVLQLQQIVSRLAPPLVPTVLSFGRFIADGAHNIIPDEVLIQGTLRTFDEKWRKQAKEQITKIAQHTAASMGATAEVDIEEGYPVLINNPEVTGLLQQGFETFFKEEELSELPKRMTTEDFARYSQLIPACFLRLGTELPNDIRRLHTPTFDINENALLNGTKAMAAAALILLDHFTTNKKA